MKAKFYIAGGFGNLLFQYLGFKYLQKNGVDKVVIKKTLISSTLITKTLNWQIHEDYSNVIFKDENIIEEGTVLLDLVNLSILWLSKFREKSIFRMKYVLTQDESINSRNRVYMGYFQNLDVYGEDFFKWTDKIAVKLRIQYPKDRVAIHLRFGDSVWAAQNKGYYNQIISSLKVVNDTIYVVSDDHKKSQEFLERTGIDYKIYSSSMLEEFTFLAESSICYCAPSTFSWWAAALNIKQKRHIIMPSYFKDRFKLILNNLTYR